MRNIYKTLSWDKVTGRGYVTDGSHWEGDLQKVLVTTDDLAGDPYLQGFLIPGEIISADEDMNRCANRKLTDILVENGTRSVPARQAQPEPQPPAFDPEPPTGTPGTVAMLSRQSLDSIDFTFPTQAEFEALVRRVAALEESARQRGWGIE